MHPVRVDGQNFAAKIAAGPPQFPQRHLQTDRLLDRMFGQQMMDRAIAGHERQAVGQFKSAAMGQGPVGTNA